MVHSNSTRVRSLTWAAVLALPLLYGCDEPEPAAQQPPPPRPVEVVEVKSSDLPLRFEFVGRTESSQRVEIRARVEGYLDEIAYMEGEFVEAGQVLFQIDPLPFESQLRAAKAELAQQQARLANAEALLARVEPLARAEAVAEKELDDARGSVNEARAAVESAAAGVYDAELNLGYTTVTSPVRGLTGEASQREGAFINAFSEALTYVARINPMWVEFSLTETQMLRGVREEKQGIIRFPPRAEFGVEVELSDGTVHPHTGRISFTDATVSSSTGSVLVRADIPNPEETLRPGQYVRIFLTGAVRPDALIVPKRAVREGPKGAYLWLVTDEGVSEQRPVQLGPWHESGWVIENGIRPGERVIVNGTIGLSPAAPVVVGKVLELDEAMVQNPDGEGTTP